MTSRTTPKRSLKEALLYEEDSSQELFEVAKTVNDAVASKLCLVAKGTHVMLFDGNAALDKYIKVRKALYSEVIQKLYDLQIEAVKAFPAFFKGFLMPRTFGRTEALFLKEHLNRLFGLLTSPNYQTDREYFFSEYPEAASYKPSDVFMFRKRVHEIEKEDSESVELLRTSGNGWSVGTINDVIRSSFVGMVTFTKPSDWNRCSASDVRIVQLAAAEKGWGPLLYDIAMSLVYPNYLVSSREDVSGHARKVWDHYLLNRPDIEHVSLGDLVRSGKCDIPELREITDELEDARARLTILQDKQKELEGTKEAEALANDIEEAKAEYRASATKRNRFIEGSSSSYKFRIRQPITNTKELEANTDAFLDKLRSLDIGKNKEITAKTLAEIGESYFWSRYQQR